MNKLWIAGPLLCIASSALAQNPWSYYAGIKAGANLNVAELEQGYTFDYQDTFNTTPTAFTDINHTSATGQLQLGAGYQHEMFYLGAELSGQVLDGNFNDATSSFHAAISLPLEISTQSELELNNFELALDLKPGVFLYERTLLYARIGVGANELSLNQNSFARNPNGSQQITVHSSASKDVYPFRLGLGLERKFTEQFSVVMDYIYSQYGDISTSGHQEDIFPPLVKLDTHTKATDVSRQTVMLGLNYYFQ